MTRAAISKRPHLIASIIKPSASGVLIYLFIPIFLVSLFEYDSLASDLQLNDGHLFEYATHLYQNGEYYRAITEYKRLLFFFPDSKWVEPAGLQIGRSYMAGNRLHEANKYWRQQLAHADPEADAFQKMQRLLGISLLDLNQTSIFRFREPNIAEAVDLFNKLDASEPEVEPFRKFTSEWQERTLEKKSPWMAATFSAVIPGAGSFYTGRYLEGTYAFFLTALFYLATRDAIARDQPELSILFGLLTVGFYGGSIYASVNGAHKLNDLRESNELLRLRQKYGIWFIPATNRYPGRF